MSDPDDPQPPDAGKPAPRTRHVAALIGLDSAVRAGIGFVVGVVVARYLGPADYGTLALAITVVTILLPIGGLGTDGILIQRLAEYGPRSAESRALLRAASSVRAAGAVLTAVAAVTFAALREPKEGLVVILVAPALLAGPFEAGWGYVLASGRVGRLVSVRISISVVVAIIKLSVVRFHGGVPLLALVTGIEILTLAVAATLVARSQGARFAPTPSSRRELLAESLPVMAGALFYLLMLRVDLLLVDMLLGENDTGRYAAVVRFAEASYLVAAVAVAASAPRIVAGHRPGSEGYEAAYRRLLRGLGVTATVLAAVLSIGSEPLLRLLLGPAYAPAAPVLAICAWSAVPVFVGTARERLVIDYKITRTTIVNTMAGAGLNVVLNLVLLPTIGLVGAGIATVVSYLAMVTVFPALDRRQRPVNQLVWHSLVPWLSTSRA